MYVTGTSSLGLTWILGLLKEFVVVNVCYWYQLTGVNLDFRAVKRVCCCKCECMLLIPAHWG